MHIQDLAGVGQVAIDPSVFSISGDQQMVGKLKRLTIFYCALYNIPPL